MVSGYDSAKSGYQILTVTYKGYTCQLTVGVFERFDFNLDGGINSGDMILLKKELLGNSSDLKYDIDQSGEINLLDLICLKKYLAGIYSAN